VLEAIKVLLIRSLTSIGRPFCEPDTLAAGTVNFVRAQRRRRFSASNAAIVTPLKCVCSGRQCLVEMPRRARSGRQRRNDSALKARK
jgi:hypothetical protein